MDLNQIKPKPRPDDVPVGNVKRESGAVTESIRPKTIKKRPRDRAKEFGDLEYRADLDTQLSWNPIARLGFDPDKHKVIRSGLDPMAAYLRDINNFGKKALEKGYISPEEEKKIKDDNIITGSDVSVSPIIAHEFTHRGFNILRNKMNENPEAFEEKYGKQARRILEFTSKGDLKSDFEEYYVELFDDLDTKFNSDAFRVRGLEDDLRRTVQSSKIGPNYPLSDSSDRYRNNRIRQIKTFQNNIEKYRKKGKLSAGAQGIPQDINNGILGLMDAAQDILTEQGEPPKAKRKSLSFFEKLGKMVGFNEGGAVMEDQMEMAFMNEGGIADDGMDVDPVSGNEVPPGSLAEEVRDDIPAQLSEGEYVVPADVVRYYGVKFFEDLRDQAKMGLAQMEADGRIGGEPVPDGGPVNDKELSPQEMQAIQEMMGMAEGGEVQNPYLQQQQLYSQPRPAPIDEKRNTTLTNINPNPVQNQMPMQSMASGGQVQGYQTGNPVTPAQDEMMYAKNEFNPFGLGAGFSFMPSIPGAVTPGTGTSLTPTIAPVTGEPTMLTLYGPNGEIRTFNLPLSEADAAEVKRLKEEEGYSETKAVTTTPVTGGGGGGSSKSPVETDPNKWMEMFDYNDMDKLGSQTSDILNKKPMTGSSSLLMNGNTAAMAAANIIIMKENGASQAAIAKAQSDYDQFVDKYLRFAPRSFINGDRFAKDIVLNNPGKDIGLFRDSVDLNNKPLFKDNNAFNKFMQKTAPEGMTFDPNIRSTTTDNQGKSVEVRGGYTRSDSPSVTTATSAVAAAGGKLRPEPTTVKSGSKPSSKPSKPKTQAQKDSDAKSAINDWVSATNATKGKKGMALHKAIKAQSDASRKATAAIREASGYNKKNEGGLMKKKGKKK